MTTANRRRTPVWVIYVITLVLSACSLIYELLIAQTLSLLAANTVTWYSVTIGTYLAFMGFGAFVLGARYQARSAWSALFQVELLLSIVGACAVPLVHFAHILHSYLYHHQHDTASAVVFFGSTFLVIAAVGFLTGIELPLLIRLGNELSGSAKITNRVLGVDYLGALVGGVAFPILLVPYLELFTIGFLTATLNLLAAMLILALFLGGKDPVFLKSLSCGALLMVLVTCLVNLDDIEQYFLKKYYYYSEASRSLTALFRPMPGFPEVLRSSSPYQKIDIVHDLGSFDSDPLINAYSTKFLEEPDHPKDRVLFLNGDTQVFTNYEEIYHESFAHIPILLNGSVPERVLTLGAGDGLLVDELRKYPQIREMVHVDLDPKMVAMARKDPLFTAMNDQALEDPRIEIIIGDAYQYIRTTEKKFDAIYLDFPVPVDYNLAKLFSREFYHFVRMGLAPGGFAVLDAPGTGVFSEPDDEGNQTIEESNDWEEHYHTVRMAGFETILPFVSTLEIHNEAAKEILRQPRSDLRSRIRRRARGEDAKPMSEQDVLKTLRQNVNSLQTGFIAMWPGKRDLVLEYRDLGVPLHFLNSERFHLAITRPFPIPEEIDPSKVNSIMRPTLPSFSVWYTRIPW